MNTAILVLTVFFATAASAQQGWVPLTSGTTEGLSTLCILNKDTIYASGGSIDLRTLDAGLNWQIMTSLPQKGILYYLDDTTAFLVGLNDTVYKTTNNWQTWIPAGIGYRGSVVFKGRDSGWTFNQGYMSRTTDGGSTWQDLGRVFTDINCIAFADTKHGFAGGRVTGWTFGKPDAASFSKTNDGGANWFATYPSLSENGGYYGIPSDIYAIVAFTSDTLFAFGGTISKSNDGGLSWDTLMTIPEYYHGACFPDRQHGTAVGSNGIIIHTTDGGLTWAFQNSGITDGSYLYDVAFSDSLNGYAVGDNGIILKTVNGGVSWVKLSLISGSLQDHIYPQPANEKTFLAYSLPDAQRVTLSINGVTGAGISEVLSDKPQSAGPQSVTIDTSHLASGTYAYVLRTEKYYATGKIIVIH